MPTATITSKGQITIPNEVRKSLRLHAGDKVDFVENDEGHFVLRPKTGSIMEMKGIFKKLGYTPLSYVPSIEQMEDDIGEEIAEDYRRSTRSLQIKTNAVKP